MHRRASAIDVDAELMLRFQAGDDRSFERLVDRHEQRVFGLVYRFLGGRPDAEDVAQDIFLKVYRARGSYSPRARFTTWLYAICRNTCFNVIRDGKGKARRLPDGNDANDLRDPVASSPLSLAIRRETAEVVRHAVDSLPASQRMAVILQRFEGLTYEEIGEVLETTAKAVKSLLHRARVNLRERLADYVET